MPKKTSPEVIQRIKELGSNSNKDIQKLLANEGIKTSLTLISQKRIK